MRPKPLLQKTDHSITQLVISPGPDGTQGISHPLFRLWPGAQACTTDLVESISQQQIHSSDHSTEPPSCMPAQNIYSYTSSVDTVDDNVCSEYLFLLLYISHQTFLVVLFG